MTYAAHPTGRPPVAATGYTFWAGLVFGVSDGSVDPHDIFVSGGTTTFTSFTPPNGNTFFARIITTNARMVDYSNVGQDPRFRGVIYENSAGRDHSVLVNLPAGNYIIDTGSGRSQFGAFNRNYALYEGTGEGGAGQSGVIHATGFQTVAQNSYLDLRDATPYSSNDWWNARDFGARGIAITVTDRSGEGTYATGFELRWNGIPDGDSTGLNYLLIGTP